jgi:soluble lytic murein transglycosylase-like protein
MNELDIPPMNVPFRAGGGPMALQKRWVSATLHKAAAEGLSPALVCALIEVESGWRPWAFRYNAIFFSTHLAPLIACGGMSPEAAPMHAISYGLMNVLGNAARRVGFKLPLSILFDPAVNLRIGCITLRREIDAADGDIERALVGWNWDGDQPDFAYQVMRSRKNYAHFE